MDNPYERDVFERLPEKVMRPGGLRITDKIARKCQFGKTVLLDIGCGTGITIEFLEKNYGVCGIGIDISKKNIERGKKRNPALQLLKGDATSMVFGTEIFDAVLMECSLSTMENRVETLKEAFRVLKPEGRLVITDLYIKDPEEQKLQKTDCFGGSISKNEMISQILSTGFRFDEWEDESNELTNFVINLIFEYGTIEAAGFIKDKNIGYFSLIATKPN